MSNILPLPQPTLRLSAWGVLRETRSRSGKSQAVANRTMTSSHSPSDNEVSKSSHGRLHGTLLGVAIEGPGPCPLYWLVYRHNNQISVGKNIRAPLPICPINLSRRRKLLQNAPLPTRLETRHGMLARSVTNPSGTSTL